MVKRLFLCTVGFTETPIIKLVMRHGIKEGDVLLLARPIGKDPKAEDTIKTIREFVSQYVSREESPAYSSVRVEEVSVEPSDFPSSVYMIKHAVESYEPDLLIANLSGGMRGLVVEALVAAMLAKVKEGSVEVDLETRTGTVEVDIKTMKALLAPMQEEHLHVIKLLASGSKTVGEIAREFKVNVATAYRWIAKLQSYGLVSVAKQEGSKAGKVELTDMARPLT